MQFAVEMVAHLAEVLLEPCARLQTGVELGEGLCIRGLARGLQERIDFSGARLNQFVQFVEADHKLVVFFPYKARLTD